MPKKRFVSIIAFAIAFAMLSRISWFEMLVYEFVSERHCVCKGKKDKSMFDTSKIPDIWDNLYYDLITHRRSPEGAWTFGTNSCCFIDVSHVS